MDFKDLYETLQFDKNKPLHYPFKAVQGDSGSRGFYVRVVENGEVLDIGNVSMVANFISAKGNKKDAQAVKENNLFRVDIPDGILTAVGTVKGQLKLVGSRGEFLQNSIFEIEVTPSIDYIEDSGDVIPPAELVLIKNRVTTLENKVQNLEDSGEGGINVLVEDNLTSNSATNALSARQGKELDSKISTVETKIDDLEIGGRNYIQNFLSDKWEKSSAVSLVNNNKVELTGKENVWATMTYEFEGDFNTRYTLSVFGNGYFGIGQTVNAGISDWIPIEGYKEFTFVTNSSSKNIRLQLTNYRNEGVFTFENPQIEKGNKATNWTPAPEDLVEEAKVYTDNKVDSVSQDIQSILNRLEVLEEGSGVPVDPPVETITVHNLVKNGNMLTGTQYLADSWEKAAIPDAQLHARYLAEENAQLIHYTYLDGFFYQDIPYIEGNIYGLKFLAKKENNINSELIVGTNHEPRGTPPQERMIVNKTINSNEYNVDDYNEFLYIVTARNIDNCIGFGGNAGLTCNAIIKDVLVVDLTEQYGAGNEPTIQGWSDELDNYTNRWYEQIEFTKPSSFNKKPNPLADKLVFEDAGYEASEFLTSYDGNLYTIQPNNDILKSTDGGISFEVGGNVSQFGARTSGVVFSDGSIVVQFYEGKMVHGESFEGPFTETLDTDGEGFSILSLSSFDDGTKKYVFANEYEGTTSMKTFWFSEDGGLTYRVLKEGDTLNDVHNNHWHDGIYDPYTGDIWLSQGDGVNARMYHTSDMGNTWNMIDGPQPTLIHAFPDRIIFGRDDAGYDPGIWEWNRNENIPTREGIVDALTFNAGMQGYIYYPNHTYWHHEDENIYYVLFPHHGGGDGFNYIFATGDGGNTWHEVYKADGNRLISLYGVDKDGYLHLIDNRQVYKAKAIDWV